MAKQPNILILMVDQLSGEFFPDGPADFVRAPNLKRLAERSTNFNNAYCASPLCSPARASFMCGSLPSDNKVFDNAAELASSVPTFAHGLRALGYTTILSGKMHFVGPDQLHGFEERLTTDIYPADFGWTPDWEKPHERVDWWYHNLSSVTQAGVATTSNQLEFDDAVAYHAKLKLHQLARLDRSKPFCLTVSFTHPHDPYVCRQKYWDLYEDGRIPEPKVSRMPLDQQDPHSQRLFEAFDHQKFEITSQDVANARRAYCGNISYLDEKIGELLNTLEECDLSDDTVIVFTADHGDMMGERGLWYKMSFFESSMKVPLLFSMPNSSDHRLIEKPVSVMDIAPTLIEIAGGDESDLAYIPDGVSLRGAVSENTEPEHLVKAEYAAEGSVDPMVMIRKDNWKFNYCEADPPQLFNLVEDPQELNNLAEESTSQSLVEEFLSMVASNWNIEKFRTDVNESQRNRHRVYAGLRQGRYHPWDFQPLTDASERYMRNHLDLNEVEAGARYPKPESK